MKKTLMFVIGLVMAVSSVHADDTDQLRAACQSSDKTLWVERNRVCIPRNPCKSSDQNVLKYCNRTFANFQSRVGTNDYIKLINIYAGTHGLDCRGVEQRAKLVGQDYVVCQGTDVMVFEFDDIQDANFANIQSDGAYYSRYMKALCDAGRGTTHDGAPGCKLSPKLVCDLMKSEQIPSDMELFMGDNSCELHFTDEATQRYIRQDAEAIQSYNNGKV